MSNEQIDKKLPEHLAIIMDGNGRWANRRFLPRIAGHKQGIEILKSCIEWTAKKKIKILTVFAFSSENWQRPTYEINGLFELLNLSLKNEVPKLQDQGIKLIFVGDKKSLSKKVQEEFLKAENLTRNNQNLILNICFNYGGRWDILQATQKILEKKLELNEENLNQNLALSHVKDPDFFIRTGKELRLSNFLLWQLTYTELYFCDILWPDFTENDFEESLNNFAKRERRFGKIENN